MDSMMLSILAPAFVAGVIILFSHIPLGREVLKRGIIFIDLAIAQIAGLGIILADVMGFESRGWALQVTAMISAMVGAFLLSYLEDKVDRYQEAVIGIIFVMAATASILLLANNPHGGEHLKDLLVGQILWVEWRQLLLPAIVSLSVFSAWCFCRQWFSGKLFYYIFALAITISVQLVGVYLVFACLILPALAVVHQEDMRALLIGLLLGILGFAVGLIISSVYDLPSGAVIVWVLAGFSLTGVSLLHRNAESSAIE